MTEIEILVRNRLRIPWDAFRKREEENRRALIAAMLAVLDNPPRIDVSIASVTSAARRSLRQELYTHTSRRLTEGIDVTYSLTLVPSQADYSSDSEAFSSINSTISSASYGNGSAFFTALQNYSSNSSFVGATGDIVSAPTVDATSTTVLLRTSYPSAQPTSQPTGGPKVVIRTSLQEYFVIINDVTIICATIGGVLLIALVALYHTLRSRNREIEQLKKVHPGEGEMQAQLRRLTRRPSAAVLPLETASPAERRTLEPPSGSIAATAPVSRALKPAGEPGAGAPPRVLSDDVTEPAPRIRRVSSIRAAAGGGTLERAASRKGSVAPEPFPLVRSASRRSIVKRGGSFTASPLPHSQAVPPSLAAQVAMAREASARGAMQAAASGSSSWISSLWKAISSAGTPPDDSLDSASAVGPVQHSPAPVPSSAARNSFAAPRLSFKMREIKSEHDSRLDAMITALDDRRAQTHSRLAQRISARKERSGRERWERSGAAADASPHSDAEQ